MNSDQLTKFLTIVKQRSMTKAASVLYITPSALSHSIQSLEEELGTILFIRNKKGIMLTASGEILYQYAQKIDELSIEAVNAVKNTSLITISSNHPFATFALSRMPDEYFDQISLVHYKGKEMPEMLLKGIADAIICDDYYMKQAFAAGIINPGEVSRMVVYRETLGLFVPQGHELYNKSRITYTEIKDIPLCIQMDRLALREWLSNIEANSGISFNIKFNLDEYSYTSFRNKIDFPEIRELNSIQDPKTDPVLKDYKFVRFNDFYSNRFIYMWYLRSKEQKVKPILDSITNYYFTAS